MRKWGRFDCRVISYTLRPRKVRNVGDTGTSTYKLWIGRKDFLIHKTQSITEGGTLSKIRIADYLVKNALIEKNEAITPETMATKRAEIEISMEMARLKPGKTVFTEIHENIKLNETFGAADFRQ